MSIDGSDEHFRHPLEAIVFNPVYPPRHDHRELTYFGGYPTLSRKLAWPLGPETGQPITFLGQVDLSKLPRIPKNALPSKGVLHFFGNNSEPEEAAVLSL